MAITRIALPVLFLIVTGIWLLKKHPFSVTLITFSKIGVVCIIYYI
ncbi:hypothetical protein ANAEL_03198 [Anaerolineales bacterium]|nr:hypothetical protein ANAEL_03198 [Anaerolineales bacterium]